MGELHVCWCLLMSAGVCWCLLGSGGVCRCLLVSAGVCWCLLVSAGVCRCLLVSVGVCWGLLVSAGVCWCLLLSAHREVNSLFFSNGCEEWTLTLAWRQFILCTENTDHLLQTGQVIIYRVTLC